MQPHVDWQPSLFDGGPPAPDISYARMQRIVLDEHSWVDYCPGWLDGSDDVFARSPSRHGGSSGRSHVRQAGARTAPDRGVVHRCRRHRHAAGAPPHGDALSGALRVGFDRIWVNLYRDGADSVAWHGDRNRLVMTRAARRDRLARLAPPLPAAPSRHDDRDCTGSSPGTATSSSWEARCQSEWEHTVPKTAQRVGPRMSVTIRHSQPAPGEHWLKAPTSTAPGHAW